MKRLARMRRAQATTIPLFRRPEEWWDLFEFAELDFESTIKPLLREEHNR